ncbi:MAG: mannose-1-phosphate guanylyltransferase/mannose-6-phosphate isomerase [Rhodospirillales bacterium]|nr:mannose-1-phosphate guanylyltransferase/mannose-6-phosphate isomerase [Rhodospirillales bacterium]
MTPAVHPVILSGGTGTRLWPLSRTLRPKQLLQLTSERSMLQETVARVCGDWFAPPTILCNDEHRFLIAEQLRDLDCQPRALVLEPIGRNTAPAATVAALLLAETDPQAVMLLLPSDHRIGDVPSFHQAVRTAVAAAEQGALVTFGIPASSPEIGYGYIRRGQPVDGVPGCFRIDRFIEKPDLETARTYVGNPDYAWNSGMFVFRVDAFIDEVRRLAPDMLKLCKAALAEAVADSDFLRLASGPFTAIEGESIDYAVMEHTQKGAIVPAEMEWNDVGSWSALWDISAHDAAGNVIMGDALSLDATNCYIRADGNLVAALGIDNLIVIATDDCVLVAAKDRAQDVKKIVEAVERAGRSEHYVHRRVFRPWGWYRLINAGDRFQVKEILVNPGQRLSCQMHHHRAEHWVVVSGTALVNKGNENFYLTEDQSTYIPHATRHSLENPGKIALRMIEVQSGGYLGEDDIVRFDDIYGRAPAIAGK